MEEKRYRHVVQWGVLSGSAILLLLLTGAWIHERRSREWKRHQRDYAALLEETGSPDEIAGRVGPERGIFQVELPLLNRLDRCITCHNGLEDPGMEAMPQPHARHPGEFLVNHPVQDYGCTICHGGQGRALSKVDAFGREQGTHWPNPLLEQPYIQSSCGKCHLAIFTPVTGDKGEAMEVFVEGKTVFSSEGCLGCHRARGVGGILGPDLTRQGEKTKHEYSFQNVSGEQTVSNWLKEHFKDPEMVSPGSRMLQINLEEKELDALATFVMGLSRPDIPFDYFTMPALNELKGIREAVDGEAGFAYLCSACHGKQGEGKDYRKYETGVPSIGNIDFLRVASPEFIRFTLEKGRSMRQMGSWNGSISGMKGSELDLITEHLDGLPGDRMNDGSVISGGDRTRGADLFNRYCIPCHGESGAGGVAVALNRKGSSPGYGDEFIRRTLIQGRRNTAMPGWPQLETREVADLSALILGWSGSMPITGEMSLPEPDPEEGAVRFHYLCSRCHGEFGEGETGPAIINRDFLNAAGDRFLYETIAEGREHTAMFGWSADLYNQERLGRKEISDIIGFMRKSAGSPLTYLHPGSNPGDKERGAAIFRTYCAPCHGLSGEGPEAPALNNQEFLSAATNGYLMATITLGRGGTAMPPWGYGKGEYRALNGKEREDLVAFVRSWQRIRIRY